MKVLSLEQIKFENYFLKENEDILPCEIPLIYNLIKVGTVYEDRVKYPNRWFLFDKNGDYILHYNEKDEYYGIDSSKIRSESSCELSYQELKNVLKLILEQYFKYNIKSIIYKT